MRREEDNLQIQAVGWFRAQYPKRIIAAIPNGYGHVKPWVGAIWKRLGVLAGMPDLLIPEPCGDYHGVFAETKSKKGVLNENQKNMGEILREKGYYVFTYKNFETFMAEINLYFNQNSLNELTRIGEEMGDYK